MKNKPIEHHEDYIPFEQQKIINVEINREMRKSFLDYSMAVIVSRALPDVRDGLKPVHRRILYTMYENSLYPEKAYRKCADTVGAVLGRYHPHGDASVYDAMVRLAQPFSQRYMLVDGHGNFGSVDGDPPAAMRYTESRMTRAAMEMLQIIHQYPVADPVPGIFNPLCNLIHSGALPVLLRGVVHYETCAERDRLCIDGAHRALGILLFESGDGAVHCVERGAHRVRKGYVEYVLTGGEHGFEVLGIRVLVEGARLGHGAFAHGFEKAFEVGILAHVVKVLFVAESVGHLYDFEPELFNCCVPQLAVAVAKKFIHISLLW